jgi:hypothetical protein
MLHVAPERAEDEPDRGEEVGPAASATAMVTPELAFRFALARAAGSFWAFAGPGASANHRGAATTAQAGGGGLLGKRSDNNTAALRTPNLSCVTDG